jgi:hypothetical protein
MHHAIPALAGYDFDFCLVYKHKLTYPDTQNKRTGMTPVLDFTIGKRLQPFPFCPADVCLTQDAGKQFPADFTLMGS